MPWEETEKDNMLSTLIKNSVFALSGMITTLIMLKLQIIIEV